MQSLLTGDGGEPDDEIGSQIGSHSRFGEVEEASDDR